MKRIFYGLMLVFLALSAVAQNTNTVVSINLTDARLQSAPYYTNRTLWINAMSVPTANSPSVVLGATIIGGTDINGIYYLSNAQPYLYQVTVRASPYGGQQEVFKMLILSTDNGQLVNAADRLAAASTATFPAGSVAWAAAVTDNRYARFGTAGVGVAAGTNVITVTNGNLVTVSSTGGGGSPVAAGTNVTTITSNGVVVVSANVGYNLAQGTNLPPSAVASPPWVNKSGDIMSGTLTMQSGFGDGIDARGGPGGRPLVVRDQNGVIRSIFNANGVFIGSGSGINASTLPIASFDSTGAGVGQSPTFNGSTVVWSAPAGGGGSNSTVIAGTNMSSYVDVNTNTVLNADVSHQEVINATNGLALAEIPNSNGLGTNTTFDITGTNGLNLRITGGSQYKFSTFGSAMRLTNSVFNDWVQWNGGFTVGNGLNSLVNLWGAGGFGPGNIDFTGVISGNGSGLTNLNALTNGQSSVSLPSLVSTNSNLYYKSTNGALVQITATPQTQNFGGLQIKDTSGQSYMRVFANQSPVVFDVPIIADVGQATNFPVNSSSVAGVVPKGNNGQGVQFYSKDINNVPGWNTFSPSSPTFDQIGSGTNSSANMGIGVGSSLQPAGGNITASFAQGANASTITGGGVGGQLALNTLGTNAGFNNAILRVTGNSLKYTFDGSGLTNVSAASFGLSNTTIFIDGTSGNDATAQRGKQGLPFQTLQSAAAAALPGDSYEIAPGYYAVGAYTWKPTNAVVFAHGATLVMSAIGGNGVLVPGGTFAMYGGVVSNSTASGIGFKVSSLTNSLLLRGVRLFGGTDCLTGTLPENLNIDISGGELGTYWDAYTASTSGQTNISVAFNGTVFHIYRNTNNQGKGMNTTAGQTIHCTDCAVVYDNGFTNSGNAAFNCGGGSLELTGCSVIPGTNSVTKVVQTSGVCIVDGPQFSVGETSGTITWMGLDNTNYSGAFTGLGSALTNLNASSISSGTVPNTALATGYSVTNLHNFGLTQIGTNEASGITYFYGDGSRRYTNSTTLFSIVETNNTFTIYGGTNLTSVSNFLATGWVQFNGAVTNTSWSTGILESDANGKVSPFSYLVPTLMGTNAQLIAGANITITTNFSGGVLSYTIGGSAGGSGWLLTGNSGTTEASSFLGTTDGKRLHIRVNNTEVALLDTTNVILGASQTLNTPAAVSINNANVIGGGSLNIISNTVSGANVIAGGNQNKIDSTGAGNIISGGVGNWITNVGSYGTIAGGTANAINGDASGSYGAFIAGGLFNYCSGSNTFAAGKQAFATNAGAFVFADSVGGPFGSTNANSFNVRAAGGVRLVTAGGVTKFDSGGAQFGAGVTVTGTNAQPGIITLNDTGTNRFLTLGQWAAPGYTAGLSIQGTNISNGNHLDVDTNFNVYTFGTNEFVAGTRTFHHDGSHTVITNTATVTSSEWTAGSQKEYYNGLVTMTIDKTNGLVSARGADFYTNSAPIWTPVLDGLQSLHFVSATNFTLSVTNFPTTTMRYPSITISNSGANASTILVTLNGFCALTNNYPTSTFYVTNLTAKRQQTRLDGCFDPVGPMTNGIVTHLFDK